MSQIPRPKPRKEELYFSRLRRHTQYAFVIVAVAFAVGFIAVAVLR